MSPEQLLVDRADIQCRLDRYRQYMQVNRHKRELYLDCRRQFLLWQIELIKIENKLAEVLH